jgi:hypothetical protein
MPVSEILSDVETKVLGRMEELAPSVKEFDELEQFAAANFGVKPSRSIARASSPSSSSASTRRRARSDGPQRSEQFLDALAASTTPLKVSQVAAKINEDHPPAPGDKPVTANYLYRVRDGLLNDSLIAEGEDSTFAITDAGREHIAKRSA